MTDRLRQSLHARPDDPIADPVSDVPVVNLANALTIFRILLVPVFLVALFVGDGHEPLWRVAAWVVFAVAAVTDQVDGKIARSRGLITDFGKMADPIADKALIGAALVGLSLLGDLAWWATVLIIVRELGVTGLRFWVIRHAVIPASRGGKLKTLLQVLAIGLYILPLPGPVHWAAIVMMAAAVVMTIVTGLDYIWQAVRVRAEGRQREADRTRAAGQGPAD
ncbi:CDP-diacylglycerol--glycerol-3-phosphate 3-phosphatidyltransferase [Williamsia deligens]|uniref:CDP-diacylglycerol--glycerol-3-phosphate 3-phosphatidyltransferase n=1 Tax=Williamsia deligens TaxID=321325 RepID=A0ABW3GCR3_9NOCA|nr:CDP-diacylglycerol--glycerol-3-phosphate 3-phosphatidyltransferase [Williamsia deligens]